MTMHRTFLKLAALATEPGPLLEQALLEAGLTRSELARRLGVSRATVGRWCKGKRKLTVERIRDILRAMR